MGTSVFPSLPGMAYPVSRSPMFSTVTQTSISGMETRIALQSAPRWKWEVPFNVLRSSLSYGEMQQLVGFFNNLYGSFDTFLYADADDNAITNQQISTGDGVTTAFQLVRTFGGFIEPMLAPKTSGTINIYLNGVKQTSGNTVSGWGSSTPGIVTFAVAPPSGAVITADFSYYWPCRMQTDSLDLSLFVQGMYDLKKFSFISVKN